MFSNEFQHLKEQLVIILLCYSNCAVYQHNSLLEENALCVSVGQISHFADKKIEVHKD